MRPAQIQISLRIRAVWPESSQFAFWIANIAKCLHADNEDSDQTAEAQTDLCFRWAHMPSTVQLITPMLAGQIYSIVPQEEKVPQLYFYDGACIYTENSYTFNPYYTYPKS